MGHNYNSTSMGGITKYIPSSLGGRNPSNDKGVSSVGTPVTPVLPLERVEGQGSGVPEIERESDALKRTIILLKDEIRKLESEVKSLQQGQDFRSYDAEVGTPHDELQRRIRNVYKNIITWSRIFHRDLLKLDAKINVSALDKLLGEQLDKVLGLGKARELINNEDPGQEVPITLSDLYAAIASNIIVEQAVLNPLISCTPEFRKAMSSKVYEMMSSDHSSQANQKTAKMWQSACLKMYDLSDEFGSESAKEIAHEQSIDDIMFMVSKALGVENYGQANHPKLRTSISLAVDIGKELGQSLSGLVLMNKGWLQEHVDGDGYISVSTMGSRIEPRSPPDGGKTIVKGKVALVLLPGLLKYGSDDGEHWDSWTVWTPAKVHLMDEQIEEIPQEAPDRRAYQPPANIAHSDRGIEWKRSQDIAPKRKRERPITQLNRQGTQTRDIPHFDEDDGLDYPR